MCIKRRYYAQAPYYEGEPMEEAMRDDATYPPMRVWDDSLKYILATAWGHVTNFQATPDQLREIHHYMMYYTENYCHDGEELKAHLAGIAEMWPELKKKLMRNAGLVKFMCEWGAHSLSFARFPVSLVPRAIALESAYGVNYDNTNRYRKLAPGCISMRCAAKEPIFVDLRRRTHNVQRVIFCLVPELRYYKDTPAPKKLARIIDCGAGLLLEFRKYGFTLAQIQSLDIIACDMDETLLQELDVVFMHDFGVPFSESGIDYRLCGIQELLADKSLYGTATVVMMDGVLSYCHDKAQLTEFVRGAKRMLHSRGVITCDLQLFDWSLVRCAVVQGWESAMKPEWTAGLAIRKMRQVSNKLNLSMVYEVDPRNPHPIGVFFALTKR